MRFWVATALFYALVSTPQTALAWFFLANGQKVGDVVTTLDGDVISGGSLAAPDELAVVRHSRFDGAERWRYSITTAPKDRRHVSLAIDVAGSIFASGRYEIGRDGPFVGHVVKLASGDGAELWRAELPNVGIYDIAADEAGDLILTGSLRGAGGVSGQDLLAIKLDGGSGTELWRTTINGLADDADNGSVVAINSKGDPVVAGTLFDNADLGYSDFFVLQLSGADGAEIWRMTVPSVQAHGGRVEALGVDESDNVIAAGHAVLGGGWCDWVVVKLSPIDGSEIWRAVFDGGGCDNALALGIAPSGDVVVTGARGLTLFVTMKYASTDGSQIWRHDIQNLGQCTGGGCAVGKAVTLHPNGDAFVAGTDPIGDIIVARLSRDDGHERWREIIDHDGCGDGPSSLALDGAGNLAIGGFAFEKVDGACAWPQGGRYWVMKLKGADGSSLFLFPVPSLPLAAHIVLVFLLLGAGLLSIQRARRLR